MPDPAETEKSLELMMDEKLNIPYSSHVVIFTWLIACLCRKQFWK